MGRGRRAVQLSLGYAAIKLMVNRPSLPAKVNRGEPLPRFTAPHAGTTVCSIDTKRQAAFLYLQLTPQVSRLGQTPKPCGEASCHLPGQCPQQPYLGAHLGPLHNEVPSDLQLPSNLFQAG